MNHSSFMNLVRRVWIEQDKRPVVRVTGSHQRSCVFGAISMEEGNKKKKKKKKGIYSDNTMNSTVIHFLNS